MPPLIGQVASKLPIKKRHLFERVQIKLFATVRHISVFPLGPPHASDAPIHDERAFLSHVPQGLLLPGDPHMKGG